MVIPFGELRYLDQNGTWGAHRKDRWGMEQPAIKKLRKLGWKECEDKWTSPDTAIDYPLEEALRIAGIKAKISVGNVGAWLCGFPHIMVVDSR